MVSRTAQLRPECLQWQQSRAQHEKHAGAKASGSGWFLHHTESSNIKIES